VSGDVTGVIADEDGARSTDSLADEDGARSTDLLADEDGARSTDPQPVRMGLTR